MQTGRHRTIKDIAQEIVQCIAQCKMFIKNAQETPNLATRYMKLLDMCKRMVEFLRIEYTDLPTPLLMLESISDYFRAMYLCKQAYIDAKFIDQLCFQRFQALCREFIMVAGTIADHEAQMESILRRLE